LRRCALPFSLRRFALGIRFLMTGYAQHFQISRTLTAQATIGAMVNLEPDDGAARRAAALTAIASATNGRFTALLPRL
jgi:hypothetical protein